MKGKDLIECIQKYGLEEYDFPVCGDDGIFPGYISIEDASRKYHISISTIRTLIREKSLRVIRILHKELLYEAESEDILRKYSWTDSKPKAYTYKRKEHAKNEFKRKNVN